MGTKGGVWEEGGDTSGPALNGSTLSELPDRCTGEASPCQCMGPDSPCECRLIPSTMAAWAARAFWSLD
jgi:hypothetical protein